MKKQYAVFGMGSFGESVAVALQGLGCEVVAVDDDMERIEEVANRVSYAMRADFGDPEVVCSLGTRNLDGVVVAVADNMEASIMATLVYASHCGNNAPRATRSISMVATERAEQTMKYLSLLSQQFPNQQSVFTEIINLQAILNLPKGTEHFMSDLHGEYEAFMHILNNCSGVIREHVD